jgi:hypothetical protein
MLSAVKTLMNRSRVMKGEYRKESPGRLPGISHGVPGDRDHLGRIPGHVALVLPIERLDLEFVEVASDVGGVVALYEMGDERYDVRSVRSERVSRTGAYKDIPIPLDTMSGG